MKYTLTITGLLLGLLLSAQHSWICPGDVLDIYDQNEFEPDYFVAGERFALQDDLKKWQYKSLYWVSQTPGGSLLREEASVEKDGLALTFAPFKEAAARDSVVGGQVYLFYIKDWLVFRGYADEFGLQDLFWATNPEAQAGGSQAAAITELLGFDPSQRLVAKDGKSVYRPYPDIMGLGNLKLIAVLDREPVMKDMLQVFLASEVRDIGVFLLGKGEDGKAGYAQVLEERYGSMNFRRVASVFHDYLYEHRKDDRRINELWKLNRQ